MLLGNWSKSKLSASKRWTY